MRVNCYYVTIEHISYSGIFLFIRRKVFKGFGMKNLIGTGPSIENKILFPEGCPHVRGGFYEGFHRIVVDSVILSRMQYVSKPGLGGAWGGGGGGGGGGQ